LKKDLENPQVHRVAIAILTYFRIHPEAKDNAEGIAWWWVNEERNLVEESLALLVDLGTVRRERDLYSLAEHLRTEGSSTNNIERILQELQRKLAN